MQDTDLVAMYGFPCKPPQWTAVRTKSNHLACVEERASEDFSYFAD